MSYRNKLLLYIAAFVLVFIIAGVLFITWAPPVLEQIINDDGQIQSISTNDKSLGTVTTTLNEDESLSVSISASKNALFIGIIENESGEFVYSNKIDEDVTNFIEYIKSQTLSETLQSTLSDEKLDEYLSYKFADVNMFTSNENYSYAMNIRRNLQSDYDGGYFDQADIRYSILQGAKKVTDCLDFTLNLDLNSEYTFLYNRKGNTSLYQNGGNSYTIYNDAKVATIDSAHADITFYKVEKELAGNIIIGVEGDTFEGCLSLNELTIDNINILRSLNDASSCGGLLTNVQIIYVKAVLDAATTEFVKINFDKQQESDRVGYIKYTKIV